MTLANHIINGTKIDPIICGDINGDGVIGEAEKEYISNNVTYLCGDANFDGQLTEEDAELISEYIFGDIDSNNINLTVIDVNSDGGIEIGDSMYLRQYLLHQRETICEGTEFETNITHYFDASDQEGNTTSIPTKIDTVAPTNVNVSPPANINVSRPEAISSDLQEVINSRLQPEPSPYLEYTDEEGSKEPEKELETFSNKDASESVNNSVSNKAVETEEQKLNPIRKKKRKRLRRR